jgi:HAD superfamily hydrolase (TIGR01484 family)
VSERSTVDRLRPISELPIDDARRVVGVLFDVDDTVTRGGRLEVAALAALERLGDAGLLRIAITGRPLGWAEVIAHQWPVELAVGENGAGFVHVERDGVTHGFFLDEEARAAGRRALERLEARLEVELPEVRRTADHGSRRCDLAFDVGEHTRLPSSTVERLLAIIEDEGLCATRSSIHVHAAPGPWDKATGGLWAIGAALGAPPDAAAWAFVGDSGNDAAAFARFPLSVGVANIDAHLEAIPVPPRFRTRGERGAGFAELADALIAARDGASRSRDAAHSKAEPRDPA